MAAVFKRLIQQLEIELDTNVIDEFRDHLGGSLKRQENSLAAEYNSLTEDSFENPIDEEEYKRHLEDQASFLDEIGKLGNELCIIALYRQVELQIKRIAKRNFSGAATNKLSSIISLREFLPFDLDALPSFVAFDELRLINNAIKHEGRVTAELSRKFPGWAANQKFSELDNSYDRLLPLIKQFIREFASASHEHSST